MELVKATELPNNTGAMILIYGDTGAGKTTSCIQSLPEPILFIKTEKREPKLWLAAAERDGVDIDFATHEGWDDTKDFIETADLSRYNSVIVDSLSYLMNTALSFEIEDESFDSRAKKSSIDKPLISRGKMGMEGFGALSNLMLRFLGPLGRMSEEGKVVVCTALLAENPRWDRDLSAGPAFKGREFPVNVGGFFDYIGLVERRYDEKGDCIYPPLISFAKPGTMGKFTGCIPKSGINNKPLMFDKLLLLTTTNKDGAVYSSKKSKKDSK